MAIFSIYHLKFYELRQHERVIDCYVAKSPEEEAQLALLKNNVTSFKDLLDSSRFRLKYADPDAIWNSIIEAANSLFENDCYVHVADVNTNSASNALMLTQHSDVLWYETNTKQIELISAPTRETFSYDIIISGDMKLMCFSGGFFSLTTSKVISVNENW